MSKKILVVDDEPDALKTVMTRLETNGYTVIGAKSGEECLEKAFEMRPDLILLDILLPGAGGFTVCDRLKQDPETKDIPVVMLTALIGEDARKKGLQKGAKYMVSKPYDPADLLWVVEDALKDKR